MKTTLRWTLSVGLVLASGLNGLGYAAAVASSETSPAITIRVKNYAEVSPKTLAEAEEVATEIFRKAGLETQWTNTVLTTENGQQNFVGHAARTLADIQVSIFPRVMSDRLSIPDNVMGLAPGSGPDRTQKALTSQSGVQFRSYRGRPRPGRGLTTMPTHLVKTL